jgi:hydroxypyruvate reductase
MAAKNVSGWVNVPADCVRALSAIHLHAARPAGVNEPTAEGVAGAREILRRVAGLGADDLCLCLISGGGSALLPAPKPPVTLDDKRAVTRFLSAAGASIEELNIVRAQLSEIKAGGLLRACRAGRLVTLILSDVMGDPLDIIASGPTVASRSTPREALAVLERFAARGHVPDTIFAALERPAGVGSSLTGAPWIGQASAPRTSAAREPLNVVIGANALAVDAAGLEAERLGYSHAMTSAARGEGAVEEVGQRMADLAMAMRRDAGPDCLISGGEPVAHLAPLEIRGRGGRNQQLALAALCRLAPSWPSGVLILSGGTDGEDGPTDAAGAWVDDDVIAAARAHSLDPADSLRRNDAYTFFSRSGGLLKTGPTHTNVCDLRVALVDRIELAARA